MELGMIRQGDILLIPVEAARPTDCPVRQEIVLAYGETTGHAHRLAAVEVYEWEVVGQRYVRVESTEPGILQHEEHDPIPVAVIVPGVTYQVIQQTVWDLSGEWRAVLD